MDARECGDAGFLALEVDFEGVVRGQLRQRAVEISGF